MLRRLRMILIGLAVVVLLFFAAAYFSSDNFAQFGARAEGARLERMMKSPNFDGEKFINPIPTSMDFGADGYWDMTKRWLFGEEVRNPKGEIPIVTLASSAFDTPPESGLRITWMGHSSVLIEIDGRRILTDPVWAKRCSPFSITGPERFHKPPVALADLPELDAVLISHDHFDHLDKHVVEELAAKNVRFFVPLGVGAHLDRWGVDSTLVTEFDWWDSLSLGSDDFKVVATPARHFSGRVHFSRDYTLWCSWSIVGPEHRVYFTGDTGPFPGFAEIGEKYGPFDLTLMKIGAYGDKWPDIHETPEQAVENHQALRGKLLMPVHWGTFNLAFHSWTDPPNRLVEAAKGQPVSLVIPLPGQMFEPVDPPEVDLWWERVDGDD